MTSIENKARDCAQREFFHANRSLIGNEGPLVADAIDAGFDAGVAYALGNQWHDAEKELPDKSDYYIVAYEDGAVFTEYFIARLKVWKHYLEESDRYIDPRTKIVAWLTIPEYKPKNSIK